MHNQISRAFKVPFNGHENVTTNYAQAAQDLFVLSCLDGKRNGTFLDLGCHQPDFINNTFLLEKQFGWKGLSLDIDESCIQRFPRVRKTPALARDCTKLNWDEIFSHYSSKDIDYLSLDLEPADRTLQCLQSVPFDKLNFSVITFEHDFYRFGEYYRTASRNIFNQAGYQLVSSDVKNGGAIYEDWYINPSKVDFERIKLLQTSNLEWSDVLFNS